ncbi:HEAT repeat domain-containing protein [Streptomyces flavotricini]|uniref:HEAT repeat domain-containing protein n=1 Tax=Streptomyces flavotricini TaxID=66888 RepID=A0ABS8E7A4_9ACTN|nr:HEAT repeat domain-containing protein [Streptomyces flavotricini]MCC0096754.1 HEAT repeat domain-containing protein [Streptomyces flavotricini]
MEERDGLSALCAAVAAYAVETVEALVSAGADPDRVLLRAVEGGSPAVVSALLDEHPAPLPEAERDRLLVTARWWYERGAEGELRRLTGMAGPADTRWVRDGTEDRVEEVTLGGRTVRGGHGAILTQLEWRHRILAPVGELMARAVRYGDGEGAEEHVDRSAARWVLVSRRSAETWREVVAFHRHPSPAYRAFVADFLALDALASGVTPHHRWYEKRRAELLPGWAATERDAGVLARVLRLVSEEDLPESREFGLRYTGHPDPRVRSRVPWMFDRPLDPETARVVRDLGRDPDAGVRAAAAGVLGGEELGEPDRAVLLALLRDADQQVRHRAVRATARGSDRSPEVTEALAELLDAEEQDVRLSAAYGLALRDDPRTAEAYARVGPLGPEFEHDTRPDGLWRWRLRNEPNG